MKKKYVFVCIFIAVMLVRVTSIQAESGKPFTVQNGPESKIACPNVQRSLQTNMRGEDVRSLQQFLISQSLLTSDATTGFFGTLTQQAVQSFQCTTLGLCSGTPVEDGYGVVGPNTQKAVGGFCTVLKNTTSAQSGDELLTSASIVTPSQTVLIKEFIKAVHHMLFKTEAMQENIDPFVLVVANNKFPNTTYIWNRMLASRFTLQYELPPGGILALSDDAFVEILYDVILKRTPDKAGKEAHLKSLKSGQYRENVFRSILFSAESKSTNAALFATLLLPETVYKPAGKYIGSGFDTKKTTSFSSEDKILMTHFFYWYNSDKNLHIKNSDGTDSLTTHPSTYPSFSKPTFSFDSVAWYEKEMRDMIVAGIDVMLPVYWGFPDQHANTNPWSNAIFKPLEEAMLNLEKEGLKPPKIGMFYDTSTHKVNPIGQLDLTKPIDQVHFARTITDFFSQVPPNRWAQIDNQPVVVMYGSNFTKEYNQSTFTAADTEFRKQFSAKTPYFIPDVSWRKAQTEARTAWGAAVGGIVIREKVAQIGPGYDDENVANRKRTYRDRENGTFYEKNWKAALVANVNIIIVETWNEFHEGSDIAESKEYGRQYINITKQNADIWKKTASISKIPASKAVFIDHLYSCVLNRKGEKKGTEHWNKQTASTTLATMYGGFFNSKEYVAKKVAVEIFVTQLYVCTLFREPSNTEVQNWVTELAEITRPQAVERFVQSKEFTTKAGLLLNKNTGFQLLKR